MLEEIREEHYFNIAYPRSCLDAALYHTYEHSSACNQRAKEPDSHIRVVINDVRYKEYGQTLPNRICDVHPKVPGEVGLEDKRCGNKS